MIRLLTILLMVNGATLSVPLLYQYLAALTGGAPIIPMVFGIVAVLYGAMAFVDLGSRHPLAVLAKSGERGLGVQ